MAKDALLDFGSASLATKNVAVNSANDLKLDVANGDIANAPNICIKVYASADFASGDTVVAEVQVKKLSTDSYATVLTSEEVAMKKGIPLVIPFPHITRDYGFMQMKYTPKSTGTFTAVSVSAEIGVGGTTA